jgi:hypothetical protein
MPETTQLRWYAEAGRGRDVVRDAGAAAGAGRSGRCAPGARARQRALLATLLVRANQMVPAGELAEIVWDGARPAGAAALRTQVMRLRRTLGARRRRGS